MKSDESRPDPLRDNCRRADVKSALHGIRRPWKSTDY